MECDCKFLQQRTERRECKGWRLAAYLGDCYDRREHDGVVDDISSIDA